MITFTVLSGSRFEDVVAVLTLGVSRRPAKPSTHRQPGDLGSITTALRTAGDQPAEVASGSPTRQRVA